MPITELQYNENDSFDDLIARAMENFLIRELNSGGLYTKNKQLRHMYIDAIVPILIDKMEYDAYQQERMDAYYQGCMS